eukprot:m.257536 g.257536  ORF g.257536 m.257536 type:complete len:438 (+) comp35393_c0_seq1:111-1424(+)
MATFVFALVVSTAAAVVVKQDAKQPLISINNGQYNRTVSYVGQQVLRCNTSAVSSTTLERVQINYDVMAGNGVHVDVRAQNEQEIASVHEAFGGCVVLIPDMEQAMQEFEDDLRKTRSTTKADWFQAYHDYGEIVDWYTDIAEEFPDLTRLNPSIGSSHEGRNMPALHITGTTPGVKKNIWFQCQIHAREWISGATCMYIVNYLVNNYNVEPRVTNLLDGVELIVIPFANPDGYAHTWNGSRLWRKNRSPNPSSTCIGTDLNRNFPDHWGEGGSSSSPCSDTYMGASSGSELETRNIDEYFRAHLPIYGAIDWHAYSQLVLRPYGWTSADAPDEALLKEIGDRIRDAAGSVNGLTYVSQKSIALYTTTGTASDWFYGNAVSAGSGSVRAYGYTIELRDTGRYGFELPPNEIIPQGQEMIGASLDFMEFTTRNPLYYR